MRHAYHHEITESHLFQIEIDGDPYTIYRVAKFDVPVHYVQFSGIGARAVSLAVDRRIETARVSPLRLNIDTDIGAEEMHFTLPGPGYYVVQIDALEYLFILYEASGAESFTPHAKNVLSVVTAGIAADGKAVETAALQALIDRVSRDPALDTLHFPPGLYRSGTLFLRDDVRLHLAKGAVLWGSDDVRDFPAQPDSANPDRERHSFLFADRVRGASITGLGVIDGNGKSLKNQGLSATLLRIQDSADMAVDGPMLRDPANWNTHIIGSENVTFRNVKVINNIPYVNWLNTDGINPDCSRHVLIENSLMHCGDDSFAVKGSVFTDRFQKKTQHITVRKAVCVSSCAALKIGTETRASEIGDIVFEDCDIVWARRAMVIDAFDRADIHDVVFRNVFVEQLNEGPGIHDPVLVGLTIPERAFRPCAGETTVRNVAFEDVTALAPHPVILQGRTPDYAIRHVRFRNVTIAGRPLRDLDDPVMRSNQFVERVTFDGE